MIRKGISKAKLSPRVINGDPVWSTRVEGRGEWFIRRNEANLKIIDSTNEESTNEGMLGINLS